ncbi:uncharacterized protein [Dermacentor albipictus]|uniref:uncharacterized protein n=1 Tax=Dermacentor albipictus TaxID=60249 RepID=UPI0031FC4FAE
MSFIFHWCRERMARDRHVRAVHSSVGQRRCWPFLRHHRVKYGRQHGGLLFESSKQGHRHRSWFKQRGGGQTDHIRLPRRRGSGSASEEVQCLTIPAVPTRCSCVPVFCCRPCGARGQFKFGNVNLVATIRGLVSCYAPCRPAVLEVTCPAGGPGVQMFLRTCILLPVLWRSWPDKVRLCQPGGHHNVLGAFLRTRQTCGSKGDLPALWSWWPDVLAYLYCRPCGARGQLKSGPVNLVFTTWGVVSCNAPCKPGDHLSLCALVYCYPSSR